MLYVIFITINKKCYIRMPVLVKQIRCFSTSIWERNYRNVCILISFLLSFEFWTLRDLRPPPAQVRYKIHLPPVSAIYTSYPLVTWLFRIYRTKEIPWSRFAKSCPNPISRWATCGLYPPVLNHWNTFSIMVYEVGVFNYCNASSTSNITVTKKPTNN